MPLPISKLLELPDNVITQKLAWMGRTGCHKKGQLVLMYDGTLERIENIIIGDMLMGPDSLPRRVVDTIRGFGKMVEITPTRYGKPFIVNLEHVLTLIRTANSKTDVKRGEIVDVPVRDWLSWSATQKWLYKLFHVPVDFVGVNKTPFIIEPYFLGIILGDGFIKNCVNITTPDKEIVDIIYREAKKYNLKVVEYLKQESKVITYYLRNKKIGRGGNLLISELRRLGLYGKVSESKYIPHLYKVSSKIDRLNILAGLIDTDGYLDKNCFDYSTKSKQLAEDVAFIARSLGFSVTISSAFKKCQTGKIGLYWRLYISGDVGKIPCKVNRKKATVRKQIKISGRTAFSVKQLIEMDDYYGFILDGDGRYVLDDFTVTHNSGKSYGFSKLAELMLELGMQLVIIDPVGIHWGLRVAANGKDQGIKNIYVFGGLHKDIPLEASSGKLIADFIADRHVSAVLDISQFESDADKVRFATDFASRFFFRYKSNPFPVHLCLEECQEMIPQNGMRGEERMIHAFNRIWKLGRNFGIGGSLISQRPQEVNKKALNQTECFFAFQMTGPHERKAIEDWMKEQGVDTTIANDLPKLEIGTCHVWSPQWLKVSKQIKIDKKWTYNASSTPEYGAKSVEIVSLEPIEIEKLSEELKNSIEKAKENDPDILKKELMQMRSKLTLAQKNQPVDNSTVVSLKTENKKLQADVKKLQAEVGIIPILKEHITNIDVGIANVIATMSAASNDLAKLKNVKLPTYVKHVAVDMSIPTRTLMPPRPSDFSQNTVSMSLSADTLAFKNALNQIDAEEAGEVKLGRCEKAILTVLANRNGVTSTKTQVAIKSGYRSGSGGFNNSLGKLRSAGYITGSGDAITITQNGLDNLGDYIALPEAGVALQKYWYEHLPKCEGMVLRALVEQYPYTLTKEQIGSITGYRTGSGGFNNALGKLRTLELIKGYGDIIANESLF